MSLVVIFGLVLTVLTSVPVARRISKDHPHGLFVLFFVEAWERFSFYGMRTLLILYLTQHFLLDDASASRVFGTFATLVYLLPLVGGVLADRYLGARRAVAFGAVLLVVGHLGMTLEGPAPRQLLQVQGRDFPVETVGIGTGRKLQVWIDGRSHALKTEPSGGLVVVGAPESSLLAQPLTPGSYHFAVADRSPLFVQVLFASLSFIALGVGFLKGNASTLVGDLYGLNDRRREPGFMLYYFGINVGSLWAALVCGYLGMTYGWAWGFGLAAAGMLAGLVIFVLGRPLLQGLGEPPRVGGEGWIYAAAVASVGIVSFLMQRSSLVGTALVVASLAALGQITYTLWTQHTPAQRRRVWLALMLVAASVIFWTLFLQGGTSLNLFADRNVELTLVHQPITFTSFGREVVIGTDAMVRSLPAVSGRIWLDAGVTAAQAQSFNVAFVMLFAPMLAWMWSRLAQAGRNPSAVVKFALALIQVGLGFLVIVASHGLADENARLPLFVLVLTYLLHTLGELFISPVGLAELTRLAPRTLVSTLMAVWLLSSSAGNFIAGEIAQLTAVDTAAGQVLDPRQALERSVQVFEYIGWAGVGAGVLFTLFLPLARNWDRGQ